MHLLFGTNLYLVQLRLLALACNFSQEAFSQSFRKTSSCNLHLAFPLIGNSLLPSLEWAAALSTLYLHTGATQYQHMPIGMQNLDLAGGG